MNKKTPFANARRSLIPLLALTFVSAHAAPCGFGGWTTSVGVTSLWNDSGFLSSSANYSNLGQPPATCFTDPSLSVSGAGVSSNGISNNSFSDAYSNLSSGSLGASVGAFGVFGNGGAFSNASADARFTETLTFFIPAANATTVTLIPFLATMTGLESGGFGSILSQFGFGSCVATHTAGGGGGIADTPSSCATASILSSTRTGFTYGGAFPVIGPNPSAGIQARLNLFASGGVALDFSHTASVQLNLPPGVTFQSASGVFLNGTATSVPEPAPVLMSGVGLCALWALRRFKRK